MALTQSQAVHEAELRNSLCSKRKRALRAPKVAPNVLDLLARERRLLAAGMFEEATELRECSIAPELASAVVVLKQRQRISAHAAVKMQRERHQAARAREGARAARHLAMLEYHAVRNSIEM